VADRERTVLQLTQQEFGDWLELYGRRLYTDFFAKVKTDWDEAARRQDARWQSLNARVSELARAMAAADIGTAAGLRAKLDEIAAALYAVKRELDAQRTAHRDPFGVFTSLLRDVPPEHLRETHALWAPRLVDGYLRDRWKLSDPEIRRYKTVWRDAKLIAVERDNFSRKFTVRRNTVAYCFAVPLAVFDLFRVDPPAGDSNDNPSGTTAVAPDLPDAA
jgi:hypothetical protein